MKKFGIILVVCALTLGLCQCKKTEKPTADECVFISLKASYGQKGEKTGFTPSTGSFVWSEGVEEYVYVGGSNHFGCLGVLSGCGQGTDNINFSGNLDITPYPAETLYFFYLGKGSVRTGDALTNLDFSNQDGTLENVTNYHIAVGDAVYSESIDVYTATLEMKMAIAYFDVSGFKKGNDVAETVYLHGNNIYSTATVDYQTGSIVGNGNDYINMGAANAGKYVALIPSTDNETTLEFDSDSKMGTLTFSNGIRAGKYYANGNNALSVTANTLPEGALNGAFSVSDTRQVYFSSGNLQYQASTNTWRFARHQWDFVGGCDYGSGQSYGTVYENGVKCNNQVSQTYDGWIDLYCYGMWTGNHDPLYVPLTEGNPNFGSDCIFDDVDFTKTIDGYSNWKTLSAEEWEYLLNDRVVSNSLSSGARFTSATIAGTYKGLILFPDTYQHPTDVVISGTPIYNMVDDVNGFSTEISSTTDWAKMEAAGAVFLPSTGTRWGVGYENEVIYYWDEFHGYWTSTEVEPEPAEMQEEFPHPWMARGLRLFCGIEDRERAEGSAVRLVRDVE